MTYETHDCEDCMWYYHSSKADRRESCRTCFSSHEQLYDNFVPHNSDNPEELLDE